MFKIVSSLIWFILIALPLAWLFNNNGLITIVWLGYEVKIEILIFFLCSILLSGVLLLIYKFFSSVISLILGIFGIFRPDELKKREKIIRKYGDALEAMTQYFLAVNKGDLRSAKSDQKKINSLLKDYQLDEAMSKHLKDSWDRKTAETGETDSIFSPINLFFKKIFKR